MVGHFLYIKLMILSVGPPPISQVVAFLIYFKLMISIHELLPTAVVLDQVVGHFLYIKLLISSGHLLPYYKLMIGGPPTNV